MFYLYFEIANYPQLKKIIPIELENIQGEVLSVLNQSGGNCQNQTEKSCVYSFISAYEDAEQSLAEIAVSLVTCLDKYKKYLLGFMICFDYGEYSIKEIKDKVLEIPLHTDKINKIWVTSQAQNRLKNVFELQRRDGIYEVLSPVKKNNGIFSKYKTIRNRYDVRLRIEAYLRNMALDKSVFINISGPRYSGKRFNIRQILKENQKETPFLHTFPSSDPDNIPILLHFPVDWGGDIEHFLSAEELLLWKRFPCLINKVLRNINVLFSSNYFTQDCFTMITLFLKAYIRKKKSLNLLPVVLYEGEINQALLFFEILETVAQEETYYLFCLSENKLRTQKGFQNLSMEVQRLTEIQNRQVLSSCYPEKLLEREPVDRLYRNVRGSNLFLFHSLIHKKIKEAAALVPDDEFYYSKKVMERLDLFSLKVLYVFCKAGNILSKDLIVQFFIDRGKDLRTVESSIKRLVSFSYLDFFTNYKPVFDETLLWLEDVVPDLSVELQDSLAKYIFSLWERRLCPVSETLVKFFLKNSDVMTYSYLISGVLDYFLSQNNLLAAKNLLDNKEYFSSDSFNKEGNERLQLVYFTNRLRFSIHKHDVEEAKKIVESKLPSLNLDENDLVWAFFKLELARYYTAIDQSSEAAKKAKKSLISFQNVDYPSGICEGYIEFGLAILSMARIEEAPEYFEIAAKASVSLHYYYGEIRANSYKVIALYLKGVIVEAENTNNYALKLAVLTEQRDWELFLLFMSARIKFDLGEYQESKDILEKGILLAQYYTHNQAIGVFRRWSIRVDIFMGKFQLTNDIRTQLTKSKEGLLFLAEYYTFNKCLSEAEDVLSKAINLKNDHPFNSSEQLLWRDGFSIMEDRVHWSTTVPTVLERLIRALYGQVLGLGKDLLKGRNILGSLCESSSLCKNDPYNHLYTFAYAQILPEGKEVDIDDRLTVLSRSVNYLQVRAGRNLNPHQRFSFLNKNLENKKIILEAKKNKLI